MKEIRFDLEDVHFGFRSIKFVKSVVKSVHFALKTVQFDVISVYRWPSSSLPPFVTRVGRYLFRRLTTFWAPYRLGRRNFVFGRSAENQCLWIVTSPLARKGISKKMVTGGKSRVLCAHRFHLGWAHAIIWRPSSLPITLQWLQALPR